MTCFVKIGMQVQWDSDMTVQEMVDEGTRRAYTNPDNPLRASVLADPAGSRKNTKDNAPAVVHIDMIPGNKVEVSIAAKGGGSENKSKMVMLNPSDDIVEWVLKTVPTMGAGWCPPGMLGIGIGGTAEKAAVLAKEALMEHIDIQELIARGPQTTEEKLRVELYDKVNKLGNRCPGSGRPHNRAGCEGEICADSRRLQAGGDDPQLRRDPPRSLRAGWFRARRADPAETE